MSTRIAAVVVGSCLVVACSSSTSNSGNGNDGGGSGDGGTTTAQAASDRANAYCTKLMTCEPELVQRLFGSEATCVSRYTAEYTNTLAAPSTGATPAIDEACIAAYPGWACSDFVDTHNVPPACKQVTGALATGAACGFAGQCTTGFCAIAPQSLCGVCAAVPAVGDSCASQGCGQGLSCTTDTKTCAVVGGQGATCGAGAPCGAEFYCVGANASKNITGTCQQAVAMSGATCDPTSATGPGCDHTQLLTCNTMTKQCATMTLGSAGQPCGTNDVNDLTVLCSAFGTCTGSMTGVAGVCTAAAADGAMCDSANGPGCMDLSTCVAGGDGGTAGTCAMLSAATCM